MYTYKVFCISKCVGSTNERKYALCLSESGLLCFICWPLVADNTTSVVMAERHCAYTPISCFLLSLYLLMGVQDDSITWPLWAVLKQTWMCRCPWRMLNYAEIPCHSSQNGYHKENNMLSKIWDKGTFRYCKKYGGTTVECLLSVHKALCTTKSISK